MADSKLAAPFCSAVLAIILALVGFACEANQAAEERVVPRGHEVNLDSVRYLDGEIFTEARWTLRRPSGSASELSSQEGRSSSFVPDVTGRYTVNLEGGSGAGVTRRKLVFIADNTEPSLTLLAPPSGITEAMVEITAAASDYNNDPVTVSWRLSGPSGDEAPISQGSPQGLTFIPEQPGTYTVVARASDGDVGVESQVLIEVTRSSRTLVTLNRKPRDLYFSAKNRTLAYVEDEGSGSSTSSNVVLLNVDTEESQEFHFDRRLTAMAMDQAGDSLIVRRNDGPSPWGFDIIDIATKTLVKRWDTFSHSGPFFFNVGAGIFLLSDDFYVRRLDIFAETMEFDLLQERLLDQRYSQSIDAIYGFTSDGRAQWIEAQSDAALLGSTTVPLPSSCFREMNVLRGGDMLFVNGLDFYSTNQGDSLSLVGSLQSGVCSEFFDDEPGLGLLAAAPFDPQSAVGIVPAARFSVTDIENMSLVGIYETKLAENGRQLTAAFEEVFIHPNGLHYIALLAADFDVEDPPFSNSFISHRIVVGEL